MIKGIIFDFGNVLCSFTNTIFLERISNLTNKPIRELDKLIYQKSNLPKKYEVGEITSVEFYNSIVKLCNLDVSLSELKAIYCEDKFSPISGMSEIVETLMKKYKVALISNTSEWDAEYEYKTFPLLSKFNSVSFSFNIGALKPNIKIYKDSINKLGLLPHECIYIDDIQQYVKVANSLGMSGIHFVGKDKFVKDLELFKLLNI